MITRLAALFLVLCAITAHAQCIEPQTLTRSVMYISTPDLPKDHMFYTGGTAWVVFDAAHIVTAKHVADLLLPVPNRWMKIKLSRQLYEQGPFEHIITYAFVERKIDVPPMEGVYVLRVAENFRDASPLVLNRNQALLPNMPVVGAGYTDGLLHLVHGRYVRMGDSRDDTEYLGHPLIEVSGGMNRLALFRGASGGPIANCSGQAWGAVAQIYIPKEKRYVRYIEPTPWGEPTNAVTLLGALGTW